MGYTVHDMPHDGQCAFSAIGHQLKQKYNMPGDLSGSGVRETVVNFIREEKEIKSTIAARLADQTIETYLKEMSKKATWADENILYVASVLYNVKILIWREGDMTPIAFGAPNCDRSIDLGYVATETGESETHYVSLLPVNCNLVCKFFN